jgi:3-hydroxypropanoate dehydrogenase
MIDESALDALFREARSHNGWLPRPVHDDTLRALYGLAKWGPTSVNGAPMRVQFVRSEAAREKLRECLYPGNVDKTMSAPVTAVIGYDLAFHRRLPQLFAHDPSAATAFEGEAHAEHAHATAFRNATLQAAYLMLAARALGLDCGPMSGFDSQAADRLFWAGTTVRTNFLCNLGHGDARKLYPRLPRLAFDEACRLI